MKKRGSSSAASGANGQLQVLQAAFTPVKSNEYFAYPTEESQRPHDQARLVLAHHQYTLRTVNLLFRDEHLYFWRDHVSRVGWDTQFVFDSIVALGTMHRSALLLSKPNDKWRGLDTKVIGFNAYGNALKQISGESGNGNPRDPEMLIAVLILLVYFEVSSSRHWDCELLLNIVKVFSGDAAAAFRHFKAAAHHLAQTESSYMPNREALKVAAREVELAAQILVPLPSAHIAGSTGIASPDYGFRMTRNTPTQEKQQLIDLLCAHDTVTRAAWRPLGETSHTVDATALLDYQGELLRWRESATLTFAEYDNTPDTSLTSDIDWSSLQDLPLPPEPQVFDSMDGALAAALYNCHMGRTMMLLYLASNGVQEAYEYASYAYIYQNLRIIAGIWQDSDQRVLDERIYLPCNALKVGFIPLLYMGATYAYSAAWQQWTAAKLHSIGQEGFFSGEAFARCLEALALFQSQAQRTRQTPWSAKLEVRSPLGNPFSRIIPILLPDIEGTSYVAYYVQYVPDEKDPRSSAQIIGKASWGKTDSENPENLAMAFFDQNSPLNHNRSERCIYLHIAQNEPSARGWEQLLGTQTVTPDVFMGDPSSPSYTGSTPYANMT